LIKLMRREPWDLAMLVLRSVDEATGYLWQHIDPHHPRHDPVAAAQFGDAILDIHKDLDNLVGLMIAAAGPNATVVLVSDHGAGPCYKEVFLNVWLEQQGWLVRKPVKQLDKQRKTLLRRYGLTRENLAPKLDWPLAHAIRSRIPERIQHAIIPEQSVTLADVVDWSRTRAYSMGNIGQIYVNLKGREAQGIVEPGPEREQLLNDISAALYRLTDEGHPVVDRVYRAEDIYHGPYASRGPDLNIEMRGLTYISQSWREMAGDTIFGPPGYNGTHRPLGIVALQGEAAAAVGRQPELQIVDVAPTLLWLLGLPIPDDLDGKLMTTLLRSESLSQQPPQQIDAAGAPVPQSIPQGWASAEEEQEVLDRLRDLGYLE